MNADQATKIHCQIRRISQHLSQSAHKEERSRLTPPTYFKNQSTHETICCTDWGLKTISLLRSSRNMVGVAKTK